MLRLMKRMKMWRRRQVKRSAQSTFIARVGKCAMYRSNVTINREQKSERRETKSKKIAANFSHKNIRVLWNQMMHPTSLYHWTNSIVARCKFSNNLECFYLVIVSNVVWTSSTKSIHASRPLAFFCCWLIVQTHKKNICIYFYYL